MLRKLIRELRITIEYELNVLVLTRHERELCKIIVINAGVRGGKMGHLTRVLSFKMPLSFRIFGDQN